MQPDREDVAYFRERGWTWHEGTNQFVKMWDGAMRAISPVIERRPPFAVIGWTAAVSSLAHEGVKLVVWNADGCTTAAAAYIMAEMRECQNR